MNFGSTPSTPSPFAAFTLFGFICKLNSRVPPAQIVFKEWTCPAFCWSIPHQQPSPVISALLSAEISLLPTFIIHLFIFSLSHKRTFLITGDVHTAHQLYFKSLHLIPAPWAQPAYRSDSFSVMPPQAGTHHPLPGLNEDTNTPGRRVHSGVPLNATAGSNVDGHCVI